MLRPRHLWSTFALVAVVWIVSAFVRAADPPPPPVEETPKVVTLPLTHITLYTAGVGYFRHEGTVDGDARTELRFPEADVNDLIKSLVVHDASGRKAKAVTYDNRAPIEYTLKSFSIDLTDNPSIGQLLHQVRGEKVSVVDKGGPTLTGMIVSVEKLIPTKENEGGVEQLNLLTDTGLQSLDLRQARRIAFLKPQLQEEFVKALGVLAAARGDAKKAVSIAFAGEGKRKVGLGYVVEAPMWKATYRLNVEDRDAMKLQGWATIENTTDEDWSNVKVGLVAGRPVSFQMDLYDPLFVPRPQVEPDLFASLRPPMYQGVLTPLSNGAPQANFLGNLGAGLNAGGFGFGGGIGGIGGQGGGAFPNLGQQGMQGNFLGIQGGGGNLGQFGLQGGFQGSNILSSPYLPRVPRANIRDLYGARLAYNDYVSRIKEGPKVPQEALRDPLDARGGIVAAAETGRLGDTFRYTIDEPVTLPRMKSALLPILHEPIEGSRVSIYNPSVLAKHPLLGLKLVNRTKLHLAQGPVTVYEGEAFAGDARLPDMKPGETRLVSFAIDLGTEVLATVPEDGHLSTVVAVAVADGQVSVTPRLRQTQRYILRNRDTKERTVLIEHPVRSEWKLMAPLEGAERSRDFYRFEVKVKPGETARLDVVEEHTRKDSFPLASRPDGAILLDLKHEIASPAVRTVLARVLELRGSVESIRKLLDVESTALKEIGEEQDRIRKNIERVPKESDAYRRYLKKFDDQETEIESRQTRIKELKAKLATAETTLKDYTATAKAQ